MRALAVAVCAAMTLAACASAPSAEACARPAKALVNGLQTYVDGFADVTPTQLAEKKASSPSLEGLARSVARYREDVGASRCDGTSLKRSLVRELGALQGRGVIAAAIAASLRTSLTRSAQFGNASPQPEERRLTPSDDLASAVVGATAGTRIVLSAGEFRVTQPIVLLDGVSLIGAGKQRTKITSSANGIALLFLGNGALTIEGLTLSHRGTSSTSLVFIRAGSYTLRDARIAGAVRGKDGAGGNGLVVGASDEDEQATSAARVMRIERTEFVDNDASGITIGGNDAPLITDSSIRGSDVCGICYAGNDGGVLRATRFTSNAIGVTILANAHPIIEGNTFVSNRIGIQVRDRARPTITSNTFTRSRDAAMAFVGTARGRAARNTCEAGTLGVVLLEGARPTLTANRCSVLDQR